MRRVVEVSGEASLAVLHEVVQEAMGWENAHLHAFDIDGARYGVPDPHWDTGTLDESRTRLLRVLAAGDEVGYVYDFATIGTTGWSSTRLAPPSLGCVTHAASTARGLSS